MNVKNMRRLVRHLRSRENRVGFAMENWFRHKGRLLAHPTTICRIAEEHPCGTAACLAGHAALLAWQSGDMPKKRGVDINAVATEWLGLTFDEAWDLFTGQWTYNYLFNITKAQAITELERLIEAEK